MPKSHPGSSSNTSTPVRRLADRVGAALDDAITLDIRSLALFRFLLGVILVADCLARAPRAGLMMSPDGILPPDLVRTFVGHPWSWSLALLWDATWWNLLVLAAEGIAGVLLAAGIATPATTLAAWVAVVSVVRRTAPATNAGDVLLACLLFWSLFLPLGRAWSWDSRQGGGERPPWKGRGIATAALVLQVAAVYVSAGLAKWNETWWSGDAVAYALSVHDHGTPWGDLIASRPSIARWLTWLTLAVELGGPPLLLLSRARVALVALFVLFHLAILATMDVCLFPWVGMAAWVALLPGRAWETIGVGDRGPPALGAGRARRALATEIAAAIAILVAATAVLHAKGLWPGPLGPVAKRAIQATFLEQDWSVFGDVRRQRQWIYGRAELANGDVVDLLRRHQRFESTLPPGGFHSLHDQRLQKLVWELPKPAQRPFAAPLAQALVRQWDARHPRERRIVAFELRGARLMDEPEPGTIQDVLLAAWPPRSPAGRGGLERFLRQSDAQTPSTPEPAGGR